MAGGKTILGIDIGSTKITAVVGEHDPARGLIWRAINVKPTEAVDRGVIRDLNQATQDIDSAYSGAMYSSGLTADSVYVGKGISEWLPKWKANGWRRKEKNKLVPIANEALWRKLDALLAKHQVKYTRVAGHSVVSTLRATRAPTRAVGGRAAHAAIPAGATTRSSRSATHPAPGTSSQSGTSPSSRESARTCRWLFREEGRRVF